MKEKTLAKEKAFKQISFSRDFADEVSALAEAADRSPAKQIEHCVRIAQAVEQILPSRAVQGLKAGELSAAELLAGLAAVLANPGQSPAIRGIMEANPVRISQDTSDPNVFIRTNADGAKERGRLDERGEFVPGSDPHDVLKGPKSHGSPQKAEHKGSQKSDDRPASVRGPRKMPALA